MAHQAVGVVLAGGRGQRFGVPKAQALLPDGRTFLEACAETLVLAGVASIVATLPPDFAGASPGCCRVVRLPHDGLAMLDSLRLALAAALESEGWQAAVILPVDHPLVKPSSVQALLAALEASRRSAALPGHRGKHGHPVAVRREVAVGIVSRRFPAATLRDVLQAVDRVDVDVPDPGVVANCNTPERLQEALQGLSSVPRGE